MVFFFNADEMFKEALDFHFGRCKAAVYSMDKPMPDIMKKYLGNEDLWASFI